MPVRPNPVTYRCPACGWSKTVAPRSDALMPGDYFDACPACGHRPLRKQASSGTPLDWLSGLLRGIPRNR